MLAAPVRKGQLGEWFIAKDNPPSVAYVALTAVAAVMSYLIARSFRLPEAYWAPMSTLIVMQSTFRAAVPISVQYFAGTAVGAALGALTDIYFHGSVWAFGLAAFIIGLICVALRVERSAYRYASITLAIVMLVPRSSTAQLAALHRFFEVSIGLAVGLAFFALSPKPGLDSSRSSIRAVESSIQTCHGNRVTMCDESAVISTPKEVPGTAPSVVTKKPCIS